MYDGQDIYVCIQQVLYFDQPCTGQVEFELLVMWLLLPPCTYIQDKFHVAPIQLLNSYPLIGFAANSFLPGALGVLQRCIADVYRSLLKTS